MTVLAERRVVERIARENPRLVLEAEAYVVAGAIVNRFRRAQARLSEQFVVELLRLFADLGTRVERAAVTVIEQRPELYEAKWRSTLTAAEQHGLVNQILGASRLQDWASSQLSPSFEKWWGLSRESQANVLVSQGIAVDQRGLFAQRTLELGGRRAGLVDIVGDTRTALFRAIDQAREAGLNPRQTGRLIRDLVPEGRFVKAGATYRATMIARTETLHAMRVGALEHYRMSPEINHVIAFDGDGDQVCAERNGSVYTLDEAEAENDLTHPHCVLAWGPVAGGPPPNAPASPRSSGQLPSTTDQPLSATAPEGDLKTSGIRKGARVVDGDSGRMGTIAGVRNSRREIRVLFDDGETSDWLLVTRPGGSKRFATPSIRTTDIRKGTRVIDHELSQRGTIIGVRNSRRDVRIRYDDGTETDWIKVSRADGSRRFDALPGEAGPTPVPRGGVTKPPPSPQPRLPTPRGRYKVTGDPVRMRVKFQTGKIVGRQRAVVNARQAYNRATRNIDKTIRIPRGKPRRMTVRLQPELGAGNTPSASRVAANCSPFTSSINLSESVFNNGSVSTLGEYITHEVGHYVDWLFTDEFRWATETPLWGEMPAGLPELMRAIKASQAYKRTSAMFGPRAATTRYYHDERELFARAFSQWVAIHSRDAEVIRHMRYQVDTGRQWTAEDFAPVDEAMTRFFRMHNYLQEDFK